MATCDEKSRKLVCSPDTDVYHIGLPLISNQPIEVFVRLSMFSSQEHRYLSLNSLITSLQGDPDSFRESCYQECYELYLYVQGVIMSLILLVLEVHLFKGVLSA